MNIILSHTLSHTLVYSFPHNQRIAGPRKSQSLLKLGPVSDGSRHLFVEQARTTGLGERVALQAKILVNGRDAGIADQHENILNQFAVPAKAGLDTAPVLNSSKQKRGHLMSWKDLDNVPHGFQIPVTRKPNCIAIRSARQSLSYAELDARAEMLHGQLTAAES